MDQMALVESHGGFGDEVARSPVWPACLWITLSDVFRVGWPAR